MRLWTLHPKYLDARGLVALWREALLAQAVLGGQTRGYTRHPQLLRFRSASNPGAAIAFYLQAVHAESARRGYCFDKSKIAPFCPVEPIPVTDGQLAYEWAHLKTKLLGRSPVWLDTLGSAPRLDAHPLFFVVPGAVEVWEFIPPLSRSARSESGASDP